MCTQDPAMQESWMLHQSLLQILLVTQTSARGSLLSRTALPEELDRLQRLGLDLFQHDSSLPKLAALAKGRC